MNSKVTYHQQVSYCGKPRCRKCREGTGHGPYWYSYQTVDGRTTRTYVGKHLPPEAQATMGVVQEQPTHAAERDKSTIRIYVLGQYRLERRDPHDPLDWVTVTDSTWQHQRVRALLGCLVSAPGRKLGREQIMEALWPELELETAGSRLDRAVYSLRQLFEPSRSRLATSPLLLTEREMIVLAEHNQIWIDADAFEQLLAQAHASKDPGEIEKLYKEAISLYGGDFLPEDRKNEWARARRESLQRSWIGLLLDMADLYVERDALNSAIDPLDRLLSIDPTNEAAVQRLMKLLMQLGRRGEALRAYLRLQKVLQQEYRISPLPDTRNLYEELRSGGDKAGQNGATHKADPQSTFEQENTGTTRDATSRGTPGEANEIAAIQIGRTHQTPMVGREQEIEALHTLVTTREHAARFRLTAQKRPTVSTLDPQRQPQSVLLLGDVGIGKTRLAEEVSRDAKKRGWAVAWSRVYAQEGSIPYRLWIEVLRKAIEQGAWQRQEVTKRSLAFQPLEALLPELHGLINPVVFPSSVPPEQEQLRLWEAAYELLVLISDSTPLLIVLDDLQWSDNSSCELLAYLARRIHGLPIIIVGTCRDSELTPKHPLRSMQTDLQRENALESLYLEPLSNEQISSLVSSVPHVPQPVVSMISDRAAGNPFFAEELARTVGSQPDKMEPLPENIEDILPDTITAVLDLRLARLTMPCQRLLSKAAVLGGSFEFNIICAMEASTPGSDEDQVLDLLEEGLHSGMLTEEGTGTRITYHFWHPLLVSHLYEGLSAARRASQHRRAAEVLQRVYKGREGESAATITRHLVLGGADTQLIARYAELAGDHAYLLSSYPDAEEYYLIAREHLNMSLSTSTSIDEQLHLASLFEQLGECTRIQGKREDARGFYEQALEIRNRKIYFVSDEERQQEYQVKSLLWCGIGRTLYDAGNNAHATRCYQSGEKALEEAGIIAGPAWARLRLQESYVSWREGDYEEARRIAYEALKLFEDTLSTQKQGPDYNAYSTFIRRILLGDPVDLGRTYVLLSNIEATSGRSVNGLPYLNKALALFENFGCLREIAIVCCNMGDIYLRTANYTQAQAALRRSLNLAERMGNMPLKTFALGNLGLLDMRAGNLLEAEDEYRKAATLLELFKDPISSSMFQSVLATVLQEQGKIAEAKPILLYALKTSRALHVTPCIGLALVTSASLRLAQAKNQDIDGSDRNSFSETKVRLLKQAKKTIIHAMSLEGMEAETRNEGRLVLSQILLQLNDFNQATSNAELVLEEANHFELLWLSAYAQRILGSICDAQLQYKKADRYFEQAIHIARKNGMRLEHARALYEYGCSLVKRKDDDGEAKHLGLVYLREAQQEFEDCSADFDLKILEHLLEKYTQTIEK